MMPTWCSSSKVVPSSIPQCHPSQALPDLIIIIIIIIIVIIIIIIIIIVIIVIVIVIITAKRSFVSRLIRRRFSYRDGSGSLGSLQLAVCLVFRSVLTWRTQRVRVRVRFPVLTARRFFWEPLLPLRELLP